MLPLVSVTVPNVSVKFAKLAIPPVTVRFPLDSASLIPHANVPALIVVKPVKVFAAESVTVPPVFLFIAIAPPAKTALIVPLSTVYDAEEAIVAAPPVFTIDPLIKVSAPRTEPVPPSENPFKSHVPPATVTAGVASASVIPYFSVPPLIRTKPVVTLAALIVNIPESHLVILAVVADAP